MIWDYSEQAEFYKYRPNYAPKAIRELFEHLPAWKLNSPQNGMIVADVGAGTGNLSVLLAPFVATIWAIEPNNCMSSIGVERTKDKISNIFWLDAYGEQTTLPDNSVDLVTYGSSFNTLDRSKALAEAHRILRNLGSIAVLWNHRDLEDKNQKIVEGIIKEVVPQYEHGVRREGQADFILESGLFNNVYYYEYKQMVTTSVDDYLLAWKSVRSDYWNFNDSPGREIFKKIITRVKKALGTGNISIPYTTRVYLASKI